MGRLMLAVWLVAGGWCGVATADDGDRLSGVYNCIGTYPNRQPYQGTVTITRGTGDPGVYNLEWLVGESKYVGVGLLENDVLSCSWAIGREEGVLLGVIVYKVEGPRLRGRWTQYPGNGRVFQETLTRR